MGRWQGNYFCCRNCGIILGKFKKDDTGKKVPIYNEKYSGVGQLCKDCALIKEE
jgi:hypothetical protein